jgi:hypothetical protein
MHIMLVHVAGEISVTTISSDRMVRYMSDVHEGTTQSDHMHMRTIWVLSGSL